MPIVLPIKNWHIDDLELKEITLRLRETRLATPTEVLRKKTGEGKIFVIFSPYWFLSVSKEKVD